MQVESAAMRRASWRARMTSVCASLAVRHAIARSSAPHQSSRVDRAVQSQCRCGSAEPSSRKADNAVLIRACGSPMTRPGGLGLPCHSRAKRHACALLWRPMDPGQRSLACDRMQACACPRARTCACVRAVASARVRACVGNQRCIGCSSVAFDSGGRAVLDNARAARAGLRRARPLRMHNAYRLHAGGPPCPRPSPSAHRAHRRFDPAIAIQ
jgi:hypothetical protein